MTILDGKQIAAQIRQELADEVARALQKGVRSPGLAVIQVGNDPASAVYVRNKQKACEQTSIKSRVFHLPETVTQPELLALIDKLNGDESVDGILLQLPLPERLDARECLVAINPEKDVDGFHPLNMGRLALNLPCFPPCTPAGVLELLKRYNLSLSGKKAVVVGRSDIVGKPLALLLSRKDTNATVTQCHSATRDLKKELQDAEFLFVAAGKPNMITEDMVPEGCVVVDVGIHRSGDGLCGDVDFCNVQKKASYITPVPGGVGPMTIAMLLRNTVQSWATRLKLESPIESLCRD